MGTGRRFIVFSDLHLHLWNYGASTINKRNSRLLDQIEVLGNILMYAKLHDIKEIVFTGDFFHTHSSVKSEVLWAAHHFLSFLREDHIKITFLIGNHDYSDKEGDLHSIDFFKSFGEVVEKPGIYSDIFWAMSYTEKEEELREFLDKAPVNSVVLMHQGLSQIPVNSKGFTLNEILHPSMVPDHVSGAFVGHYHSRFQVHNKKIWSPGSPMQLIWTDTQEDRGLLDVTWHPDRPIEVSQVNLEFPRFVELTEPDVICAFEQWRHRGVKCEGNFIRVKLPAKYSEIDTTLIKEDVLKNGARSCEVVYESTERGDSPLPSNQSFDSLPGLVGSYMDYRDIEVSVRKVGEQIMEGTYEPAV